MRTSLFLIFGCAALCGCIESREEYTLNPDGSGKVQVQVVYQEFNMMDDSSSAASPEVRAGKAVLDILKKSSGIEAWSGLSSSIQDDDRIKFIGTAYFRDVNKVDLKVGGSTVKILDSLAFTNVGEGLVLVLSDSKEKIEDVEGDVPAAEELSEAQVVAELKRGRAEYNTKVKPMLGSVFGTMRIEKLFRLPGQLVSSSNVTTTKDGAVRVLFEGGKMVAAMEALMNDEEALRAEIVAGRKVGAQGPAGGNTLNKALYGEEAPVRAVVGGALKPRFDYAAEIAAVRPEYQAYLKTLVAAVGGLPPAEIAPAGVDGLKSLRVGGVRFVDPNVADEKNDIRPFNSSAGIALVLVAEFSGSIVSCEGGEISAAVADNGEDILPKEEWSRTIQMPDLSKDKRFVCLDVDLDVPRGSFLGFRLIEGTITYVVSDGTRRVQLGMERIAAGSKATELSAEIKEMGASDWRDGHTELKLRLGVARDLVKSVRFLDAGGTELTTESGGASWSDNSCLLSYTREGGFPEAGRIEVEVYDNVKQYVAPFKIENVGLLGRPVE